VIDKTRDVAADVRVAHPAAIHGEAPDATFREVPGFALQALLVIDQLTRVIDNPCVFRDWLRGEHSPSMNAGASPHDFGKVGVIHHLFREDNRR